MSGYRLTESTKKDLSEISAYLVEHEGRRLARYVVGEITAGFHFIAETPGAGHFRNDLTDRPLKFWKVFSYLIVYDPATDPITIARVLHSARDIAAII